ncbi:MAG: hypothetical protein A2284_09735 [Deltaproteobacteria bacterium RIFOXYA12_FULL_61_11]|nr:MAG: hypothetical protein A2284_09735 [Deltaproteobacteria bacterium RIFOXYA12_FULL_61_11]
MSEGEDSRRILLLEPWLGGAHAAWAEGWRGASRHRIEVLGLSARHWKWRMHGAAVTLAGLARRGAPPDLLVASDLLDLATFLGLVRAWPKVPVLAYFHENQCAYPVSSRRGAEGDADAAGYAFRNFTTALAADRVAFNSAYNRDSFFEGMETLLRRLPDHRGLAELRGLPPRCAVLPVGVEYARLTVLATRRVPHPEGPLLLWNHRWEHDKGPEEFFSALVELVRRGLRFRVALAGERRGECATPFDRAQDLLGERLVAFGPLPREAYLTLLHQSDILPVTSRQDFFGLSVVEALAAGCHPLLPRRLVYPELVPPELHEAVLYPEGAFVERLAALVERGPEADVTGRLSEAMGKYAWPRLATDYDRLVDDLTSAAPRVQRTPER